MKFGRIMDIGTCGRKLGERFGIAPICIYGKTLKYTKKKFNILVKEFKRVYYYYYYYYSLIKLADRNNVNPSRAIKASSIQDGNIKCETHAKMFSQTLAHGNCKNETRQRTQVERRENMEVSEVGKK